MLIYTQHNRATFLRETAGQIERCETLPAWNEMERRELVDALLSAVCLIERGMSERPTPGEALLRDQERLRLAQFPMGG